MLGVVEFVISGLMAGLFAIGIRQTLRPGRADTFGPALVGVYGLGMIGGGIFIPDPALGWPAGAPAGLPEHLSTSSTLHTVFAATAFMSLIAAGLVLARRFAGQGRRAWATYSATSSVTTFILTALPWSDDSASLRFAAGAVIISGWLAALSWRLRTENTEPGRRSGEIWAVETTHTI
jgi:hypothetical protein